jgi:hypothetical protein
MLSNNGGYEYFFFNFEIGVGIWFLVIGIGNLNEFCINCNYTLNKE